MPSPSYAPDLIARVSKGRAPESWTDCSIKHIWTRTTTHTLWVIPVFPNWSGPKRWWFCSKSYGGGDRILGSPCLSRAVFTLLLLYERSKWGSSSKPRDWPDNIGVLRFKVPLNYSLDWRSLKIGNEGGGMGVCIYCSRIKRGCSRRSVTILG